MLQIVKRVYEMSRFFIHMNKNSYASFVKFITLTTHDDEYLLTQ